ncbi:MAG TPA: HlyD family secretion protein [Terriglobales bacterium]|nr:HlyD family secretion protein [Terriglobales bacterium]
MEPTTETVRTPAENRMGENRMGGAEATEERPPSFRERRRSAMGNPRIKLFLIIVAVVVVVGAIFAWRYFTSYESTDDAQIDGHINTISSRVPGHVVRLNVEDNQYVQAGTVLVEIDPTDYQMTVQRARAAYANAVAEAQAAQANVPVTSISTTGQLSTAQADVANARAAIAGASQQYNAAKAQLEQATANNTKAQSDLARYKLLIQKQEISQQQYDQVLAAAQASAAAVEAARANVSGAEQQIIQARAKLEGAQAGLRTAGTGPRQVQAIRARAQAAEADVQLRQAELQQAELNLTYTKVVAPVSGQVSNRSVEVGQNVQAGQALMNIVPLEDLWVTANFKENQLRDMHPGEQVTVHVDANGKDYKAHVDSIAGASGARFSLLPPENATGNYVKVVQRVPVKIDFDAGELKGHELRPGMSVEPKVWTRR